MIKAITDGPSAAQAAAQAGVAAAGQQLGDLQLQGASAQQMVDAMEKLTGEFACSGRPRADTVAGRRRHARLPHTRQPDNTLRPDAATTHRFWRSASSEHDSQGQRGR
jgi:hypothetical protein